MRRPSPRCTPNLVTLSPAAKAKDTAKATEYHWPEELQVPDVRCSVQPSSAADVPAQLRDGKAEYLTVIFHADPGLKKRDRILWGGRTLAVTAVLNSSGRDRSWKALCEATS